MRKILSMMHVSLDGFVADLDAPPPGLEWIHYTPELEAYAHQMHDIADTAIHGRDTYRGMESYWPTVLDNSDATPAERKHARWLHDALKVVVSRTLKPEDITWENSLLISDNLTEEFTKLKQQPGKHMVIFGSPGLVKSLAKLDLIDEYYVNINPTILGRGTPFLGQIDRRLELRLVENRTIGGGVAALHFERVRE